MPSVRSLLVPVLCVCVLGRCLLFAADGLAFGTKGKFAEGTGSVIQMGTLGQDAQTDLFHAHESWAGWGDRCQCERCYRLREQSQPQIQLDRKQDSCQSGGGEGSVADCAGAGAGAALAGVNVASAPTPATLIAVSKGESNTTVPSPNADAAPSTKRPKVVRPVHADGSCPLLQFGLRYFHPLEIAAVMGFPVTTPHGLSFPAKITPKQAWRLLGNSLNVQVVAVLMTILLPES